MFPTIIFPLRSSNDFFNFLFHRNNLALPFCRLFCFRCVESIEKHENGRSKYVAQEDSRTCVNILPRDRRSAFRDDWSHAITNLGKTELIHDVTSSFASRWSGSIFSGSIPNPREREQLSCAMLEKRRLARWIIPGMTLRRIHSRLAQGMRFDVDRDYFGCISTLATLWSPDSFDTGERVGREGRGEWTLAGCSPPTGDETRSSRRTFVIAFSNGRSLSRCAPLSDREATAARVSPLRSDVLMGVEPAETP